MSYLDRINVLKSRLESMGSQARLDLPFVPGRAPTQAFSEFLTNKEQGDWAERTFIENFNAREVALWATKYGRSEDLVAGEAGFDAYYAAYQDELKEIGKRPDVLLFEREFLHGQGLLLTDISTLSRETLDTLVPLAKAAIEVRSSAFLSLKYEADAQTEIQALRAELLAAAVELRTHYAVELGHFSPDWLTFANACVDGQSPSLVPRVISRRSTERLQQVSELTRRIKTCVRQLDQRRFLSITPKAEDLSLVYRWLQRYGVPHYYCQVFFDRAVLISFERILELLADVERENVDYFVESDEKNQGKITFKIDVRLGAELMSQIALPEHRSAMKELPRGRLLFYVCFEPSAATLNHVEDFGA